MSKCFYSICICCGLTVFTPEVNASDIADSLWFWSADKTLHVFCLTVQHMRATAIQTVCSDRMKASGKYADLLDIVNEVHDIDTSSIEKEYIAVYKLKGQKKKLKVKFVLNTKSDLWICDSTNQNSTNLMGFPPQNYNHYFEDFVTLIREGINFYGNADDYFFLDRAKTLSKKRAYELKDKIELGTDGELRMNNILINSDRLLDLKMVYVLSDEVEKSNGWLIDDYIVHENNEKITVKEQSITNKSDIANNITGKSESSRWEEMFALFKDVSIQRDSLKKSLDSAQSIVKEYNNIIDSLSAIVARNDSLLLIKSTDIHQETGGDRKSYQESTP